VDGGCGLDPELVVGELGRGLALEGITVSGAEIARIGLVTIGRREGRPGVRRRDGGQARSRDGRDAADRLVRAGRADKPDDGAVGRQLLRRSGAARRRAQAVLRRQLDVVTLERLAEVVDCDLDALLGVLAERRVAAREDALKGEVERLTGRDLNGAEWVICRGLRGAGAL